MSQTQIRIAAASEATQIASVLRQAFVEYESLYTAQAFAATTPSARQIEQRWDEGPVWVAALAGEIVGTVAAVSKREGLYVRSMALLPASRGKAIGWSLLEDVERFAYAQGCPCLFLSTTPFLLRAIRLYERFGFRRSAEGPQELFGTALFTMVKLL